MGVEAFGSDAMPNIAIMDDDFIQDEPVNGTDSRRRLEDKIEELRLKREIQEFDFDLKDYDI